MEFSEEENDAYFSHLHSQIAALESRIAELETRLEAAVQREVALLRQANADACRIAELEKCLKAALEFVPKSVAKRLTVQGGLG